MNPHILNMVEDTLSLGTAQNTDRSTQVVLTAGNVRDRTGNYIGHCNSGVLNRSLIMSRDVIDISILFHMYMYASRKHAYIVKTPLKPHFYIAQLGFIGVYRGKHYFSNFHSKTWIVGTR